MDEKVTSSTGWVRQAGRDTESEKGLEGAQGLLAPSKAPRLTSLLWMISIVAKGAQYKTDHFNHSPVYSSVEFGPLSFWYNRHYCSCPKQFYLPNWNSGSVKQQLPIQPSTPPLVPTILLPVAMTLTSLGNPQKWSYTVVVLLGLA